MLTELVNFTKTLSDDFKSMGLLPKEGLHILLQVDDKGNINTSIDTLQYAFYSKKMKNEYNALLDKCKQLQENAWCINTNKCFDPKKAIHTCSPLAVAFKKEHMEGGEKFKINIQKNNPQIQERFDIYFDKTRSMLIEDERIKTTAENFIKIFTDQSWKTILRDIENQRTAKFGLFSEKEEGVSEQIKKTSDKYKKEFLKEKLQNLQQELLEARSLIDSDYVLFYLDLPLSAYKNSHAKYLNDKLFNTDKFNTGPNDEGVIYGTNDFQNGFNSNMPFLLHQTASFDITGRISNLDARTLYEFSSILPRRTLPNPLPIFIYNEEFKREVIALYKDGRLGFRDLVETLYTSHKEDFRNYYLLNWSNTKSGIVFNDFDFVTKFKYEIGPTGGLLVENHFQIYQKEEKTGSTSKKKFYPPIKTVFELEDRVLKYLIQNKYHRVDYFSEFKKEDYENRDLTFLSFCKYRKAVYDYVYKSNWNVITETQFYEMTFNAIRDDFKNNNEYGIKEKLNYWYSLYEHFQEPENKKTETMASKLKKYQDFVRNLIEDKANIDDAKEEQFAFAAGQVIYYLLKKSKSDDTSFRLMEPYLQKTNCKALQQNIAEDFARYKHENFSGNFGRVASFVLSYETDTNIKTLQPQLLSGLFSDNQLYSTKTTKDD